MKNKDSREVIRVSSGSAIILGLTEGFVSAKPTTTYLLTYLEGKCSADCHFCSQAKSSTSRADVLSRITWPVFATRKVMIKLAVASQKRETKRICIQAMNYPRIFADLSALVRQIKSYGIDIPISISVQPLNKEEMVKLAEAGVERIGIPLDAATKEIFGRVKGSSAGDHYDWDKHHEALLEALEVFGKGKVSTHLIVGLGETEREMIGAIQWCVDNSICPALFSFTPVPGTALEHNCSPPVSQYRRIQLARYLIVKAKTRFEEIGFSKEGIIIDFQVSQRYLEDIIRSGKPFLTSGCPNCNRPFYNEKPSGPLYNFPIRPTLKEIKEIKKQLEISS